jgi:DNA primase small subunit
VCDDGAKKMNNEARSAVTEYIHLGVGNELAGKLELSYPMHPMLQRAYTVLVRKFEEIIIQDQDLLS